MVIETRFCFDVVLVSSCSYLESLQPANVHHVVRLVWHDGHDVEGLGDGLGLLRQPCPLGILEDRLQQHVVLGQPLDGLDQQVSETELETQLQPDVLGERKLSRERLIQDFESFL